MPGPESSSNDEAEIYDFEAHGRGGGRRRKGGRRLGHGCGRVSKRCRGLSREQRRGRGRVRLMVKLSTNKYDVVETWSQDSELEEELDLRA